MVAVLKDVAAITAIFDTYEATPLVVRVVRMAPLAASDARATILILDRGVIAQARADVGPSRGRTVEVARHGRTTVADPSHAGRMPAMAAVDVRTATKVVLVVVALPSRGALIPSARAKLTPGVGVEALVAEAYGAVVSQAIPIRADDPVMGVLGVMGDDEGVRKPYAQAPA